MECETQTDSLQSSSTRGQLRRSISEKENAIKSSKGKTGKRKSLRNSIYLGGLAQRFTSLERLDTSEGEVEIPSISIAEDKETLPTSEEDILDASQAPKKKKKKRNIVRRKAKKALKGTNTNRTTTQKTPAPGERRRKGHTISATLSRISPRRRDHNSPRLPAFQTNNPIGQSPPSEPETPSASAPGQTDSIGRNTEPPDSRHTKPKEEIDADMSQHSGGNTPTSKHATHGSNPEEAVDATKETDERANDTSMSHFEKESLGTREVVEDGMSAILDSPQRKGTLEELEEETWTPFFFVLKDGYFYKFASEESQRPIEQIRISLCDLKEVFGGSKEFELITKRSQTVRKYRAERQHEYFAWIVSLRNAAIFSALVPPAALDSKGYFIRRRATPTLEQSESQTFARSDDLLSATDSIVNLPTLQSRNASDERREKPEDPCTPHQRETPPERVLSDTAEPEVGDAPEPKSKFTGVNPSRPAPKPPKVSQVESLLNELEEPLPSMDSTGEDAEHEQDVEALLDSVSQPVSATRKPVKEGELWVLQSRGFKRNKWGKRMVALYHQELVVFKKKEREKRQEQTLDLLLCQARVGEARGKKKYVFDLFNRQSTVTMAAETSQDMLSWINTLQEAQAKLMVAHLDYYEVKPVAGAEENEIKKSSVAVREMIKHPPNSSCADCGATEPIWATINIGAFICLNCAGVHRSLGQHISQVRSVTMDKWRPEVIEFMKNVGNEKANAYWEHSIPEGYQKLTAQSSTEERNHFICAKYRDRQFVHPEGPKAIFGHLEYAAGAAQSHTNTEAPKEPSESRAQAQKSKTPPTSTKTSGRPKIKGKGLKAPLSLRLEMPRSPSPSRKSEPSAPPPPFPGVQHHHESPFPGVAHHEQSKEDLFARIKHLEEELERSKLRETFLKQRVTQLEAKLTSSTGITYDQAHQKGILLTRSGDLIPSPRQSPRLATKSRKDTGSASLRVGHESAIRQRKRGTTANSVFGRKPLLKKGNVLKKVNKKGKSSSSEDIAVSPPSPTTSVLSPHQVCPPASPHPRQAQTNPKPQKIEAPPQLPPKPQSARKGLSHSSGASGQTVAVRESRPTARPGPRSRRPHAATLRPQRPSRPAPRRPPVPTKGLPPTPPFQPPIDSPARLASSDGLNATLALE